MIQRVRGLHYAWIMAATTFIVLLGASAFRSAPSILIVPLQSDFGWSRATISVAISINLILYGFMGPFAAAMMERFGIRTVVTGALMTVAAGAGLTTLMTSPWQLYLLWGVMVGLGTGSMATILAATVANRWFVERRGLVMGVLTAAGATGQLVFLPLFGWIVSHSGWKTVSISVCIATLSVIPLVLLLMRNRPSDVGILAYGSTGADAITGPRANPIRAAFGSLVDARSSRDFWLLAGSFFICGASTNGLIGTHLIPAAMDHGMTETGAASLLALVGIFDIIGTTCSGWLTDRYDPRYLLFMYYGLRGLSLAVLPVAFNSPHFGLIGFIVFYGLDWVATVPPTLALTGKSFGRAKAPLIFGWVFASHQLGAAFAAYGAGFVRTRYDDYTMAFAGAAVLCLIASLMVLQIGRTVQEPGFEAGLAAA